MERCKRFPPLLWGSLSLGLCCVLCPRYIPREGKIGSYERQNAIFVASRGIIEQDREGKRTQQTHIQKQPRQQTALVRTATTTATMTNRGKDSNGTSKTTDLELLLRPAVARIRLDDGQQVGLGILQGSQPCPRHPSPEQRLKACKTIIQTKAKRRFKECGKNFSGSKESMPGMYGMSNIAEAVLRHDL